MSIKGCDLAGKFYPYNKRELKEMIRSFLDGAKRTSISGKLKGLIVPHAGYPYSGPVAATGYKLLEKHSHDFEDVFLIGSSHRGGFWGVAQLKEEYWETPLGKIEMEKLPESSIIKNNSAPFTQENSLEVQLPFLQTVMSKFRMYGLLTGDMSPGVFSAELAKEIKNKSIIIASTDLSHYHPYEQANRIDSFANKAIPSLDTNEVESFVEACGKNAVLTLMQIAKIKKWKCKLLDYRNSGDTSGDKNSVVGYGCYAFYK